MTKPIVLVTSTQLAEAAKTILRDAGAEVTYVSDPVITEDVLAERIAAVPFNAVLLRGSPPFTERVFSKAPGLRIVHKHGVGVDSLDFDAAKKRGILIMNAGTANADAVAEHAVAMMLSLARDLPSLDRNLKREIWEKPKYMGREFRSRVVGIVGFGQIGRRTARLAKALGANIVAYSRSKIADPEGAEVESDFEKLLGRVDILSLNCPLTEKTRNLMGAQQFALMKKDAILINTARGGVVDEAALVEALRNRTIAAAGLDVFAKEPTDPKNPLFQLDNVICSPHVAAMTREAMARMGSVAAANIVRYLKTGDVDRSTVLNPEVLKS